MQMKCQLTQHKSVGLDIGLDSDSSQTRLRPVVRRVVGVSPPFGVIIALVPK